VKINKVYRFLDAPYGPRFEVMYGGAGSGKSVAVAQEILCRCVTEPGRKFLCVRKVAKTLRHSVFALLNSIIDDEGWRGTFSVHKSDMVLNHANGGQIILQGLDDVEKIKSISGITDIWIEEASEITEDDFNQLNLRLRGGTLRKRVVLTFNPINQLHWLKRYFFDVKRDNVRITKTTYQDNRFLDAEYVAELEGLKNDPYFYKVYTLGEWGEIGNVVFTDFIIEDFDYTEADLDNVVQGIDFGFNHPSAAVRWGFKDGELYAFDEFYQAGLTNTELIGGVAAFDPEYRNHRYIADSAEPARIMEFRKAGFNIEAAVKGKDSVRHGIDFMRRHRLHIHKTRCPNLAAEVQTFQYREDREGNVLDEFVEFKDDAIAASRYAFEPIWSNARPEVSITQRIW